jgi:hypothetical protein
MQIQPRPIRQRPARIAIVSGRGKLLCRAAIVRYGGTRLPVEKESLRISRACQIRKRMERSRGAIAPSSRNHRPGSRADSHTHPSPARSPPAGHSFAPDRASQHCDRYTGSPALPSPGPSYVA